MLDIPPPHCIEDCDRQKHPPGAGYPAEYVEEMAKRWAHYSCVPGFSERLDGHLSIIDKTIELGYDLSVTADIAYKAREYMQCGRKPY